MQKLKKEDYMAIIGFFGHTALISKKHKKTISKMSTEDLLAKGFYKEAIYSGIFDESKQETITSFFSQDRGRLDFDVLKREFGVQEIEQGIIQKTRKI